LDATEQTVPYGSQVASELAAAHAKEIVHRDLKPANVMISKDGVKVLDFVLARSPQDERLTQSNVVIGTPAYMAPELLQGKPCDARTDIYAFGLVLFEIATGKRVARGTPPPLDALPEKLAHVVERCLSEDPDDRWQTARDVSAELQWAAIAPIPAARPRRISGWSLAAAELAIIGAMTVALVYFRQAPEARILRSAMLPPENTSFDFASNLGPMALSPDGRRMVFAATGSDGKSRLWIRPLDSATARPLQETEGGKFPF
jgi:hypothetical protein